MNKKDNRLFIKLTDEQISLLKSHSNNYMIDGKIFYHIPFVFMTKDDKYFKITNYQELDIELIDYLKHKNIKDKELWYGRQRRIGNTTRIVDRAIQDLFITGEAKIIDHYENGNNKDANKHALKITINRLRNEHPGINFETDRKNLKIKLNDYV